MFSHCRSCLPQFSHCVAQTYRFAETRPINGTRLAIASASGGDARKDAVLTIAENDTEMRARTRIYQMRAGLSLLMKSL